MLKRKSCILRQWRPESVSYWYEKISCLSFLVLVPCMLWSTLMACWTVKEDLLYTYVYRYSSGSII